MTQSYKDLISKVSQASYEINKHSRNGSGEYVVASANFSKMWNESIEQLKAIEAARVREETLNNLLK